MLHCIGLGYVHLDVRGSYNRAPVIYPAIHSLDIGSDRFMILANEVVDHIMAELSANACYKYFHGITCSASASDRGMTTAQQFLDHIVSQLAVYSCYKYLQIDLSLGSALPQHSCRTIILS